MEKNVKLRFIYIVEGQVAAEDVDTYFYACLPNVETEVADLHTGHRVTDIPSLDQSVRITGSSIASCATLAAIISDYLQHRKSRIVICGTNKQVQYDGPSLQTDNAEIAVVINSLTEDCGEDGLTIMSLHLPHIELKTTSAIA